MKRIIVAGASGSGKTSLARTLSKKLSIPHVELDRLNWLPGWKMRDPQELKKLVAKEAAKPTWVVCGNYSALMPITWTRADTVIWLDYPLWLCLWRVTKRAIINLVTKQWLKGLVIEK